MPAVADGIKMRIGLFGGTFDPIHIGHLRSVLEVQEEFPLDHCWLVPAATPPHKSGGPVADAGQRLEMTRLAAAPCPAFQVSDVELQRSGPSYTIDTIDFFRKRMSAEDRLFLIVGLDAVLEIDSWKSYRELLQAVPLIVMARPGTNADDRWNRLADYLENQISNEYRYKKSDGSFCHPTFQAVYPCEVPLLDISSTRIRHLRKAGRSVRFLLPETVHDYIVEGGLYE
jgi:nicotinate-nucleotide adenylyltransferase